jgi:hypothetical protein
MFEPLVYKSCWQGHAMDLANCSKHGEVFPECKLFLVRITTLVILAN